MEVIDYVKENYPYIEIQNAVRVNKTLDIFKRRKNGVTAVFLLPTKEWFWPKDEEELADLVLNQLEFYKENGNFKQAPKPAIAGHRPDTHHKKAKRMKDKDPIPFGKYKGDPIGTVDPGYLIWLLENEKCFGPVKKYIEDNLDVLRKQVKNMKKGIR